MDDFCATIEQQVKAYCVQQGFFTKGMQVCVATSGGADSMALLCILRALAPSFGIILSACHVNHCMRGALADRDEQFVRNQCEQYGVPLVVYHAIAQGDIPPQNPSEQWARTLRYGCFAKVIEQQNVIVATAHTLNDQAETLLFRLARGTGAHGAAGIRPKRGQYVRPLLCLTRNQVEAYCNALGQPYVTDETNAEDSYARNQLRLHALPSLCTVNQAAVQHMGLFCEKMAAIDAYFEDAAHTLLADAAKGCENASFSVTILQQANPLVLQAAIHQLLSPIRDAEQKYITALCGLVEKGCGALQVTDAIRFVVQDEMLLQQDCKQTIEPAQKVEYYPVLQGKYHFPGGYCVTLEQIHAKNMEKIHLVHKKDLKNYANYDKIVSLLVLRNRMQGDLFAPQGRGITKTVKKLHNELGIPQKERDAVPLLANGATVVWLWGQGFAEGYQPDETTTLFLKITEEKIAEE